MSNSYGIEDIKSLSFKEGVRSRIQMYLGSADNEGIYQALKEIINNSTDEALCGFGSQIDICVDEDNNTIRLHSYNDSLHTYKAINNRYYLTNKGGFYLTKQDV